MALRHGAELVSRVLPWALDDATRLYRFEGPDAATDLAVEAWTLHDALNTPWQLDLSLLSPRADIDLDALPGHRATLVTRLSDGSEARRSGLILAASRHDSDGSLTRYRLLVGPWVALMGHVQRSQVWQERSVVDIIDSVLAHYAPQARWRWADDVADHLARSPHNRSNTQADRGLRSYTVQYRETDLAFVHRLLQQEGLVYRFEPDDEAPLGHRLVLLADTTRADSCPEDATSASPVGGPGVRFHRAAPIEVQDSIQQLRHRLSSIPGVTTVSSWDYKARRVVTGSARTDWAALSGRQPPRRPGEQYIALPPYAVATQAQADRLALLLQQGRECRWETWPGRGTVRSFTAGTHFALTQHTIDTCPEALSALFDPTQRQDRWFLLTAVWHVGINNLPREHGASITRRLGTSPVLAGWVDDALREQAQSSGHACAFEAIVQGRPWRPDTRPEDLRRGVSGVLCATVVGAEGQATPEPGQEIETDRLGRVRIAYDFQLPHSGQREHAAPGTSAGSTWVRVAQCLSGPGMGAQFIPRIGQEVLVGHLHGDIERPLVLGALYNGQGEGGEAPTPGGREPRVDAAQARQVFVQSSDHRPGGQGNRIGSGTGGHSPAWHGASADELGQGGQRNAAALSGFKTVEFGASGGAAGYNQLVFDDSDEQLRVQLATTQHATQLNMGHLIHQADNHRGSFRGLGFELRTDAYGAIRASRGVMLSTWDLRGVQGHPVSDEPAGDNAAGMALARQLVQLGAALSEAARTHQTVQLASHIGSHAANASTLNDQAAPLQALQTALSGMVTAAGERAQGGLSGATADAAAQRTQPAQGTVPHTTEPLVAIMGRAGVATVAGQDIQIAAEEGITLASSGDTHVATGGTARIHTGQAIGLLAGAIAPGQQAVGTGLTLIAGQGDVELQAQSDRMDIAAQGLVNIQSQNAHIDWAAAQRIVLSTAGGACITIEGGNITVECPGTLTVKAGTKSFEGPQSVGYRLPALPKAAMKPKKLDFDLLLTATPGVDALPLAELPWAVVRSGGSGRDRIMASGRTDAAGKMTMTPMQALRLSVAAAKWPNHLQLVAPGIKRPFQVHTEDPGWTEETKNLHALAALDFADLPGHSLSAEDTRYELVRAAEATGSGTSFQHYQNIQ